MMKWKVAIAKMLCNPAYQLVGWCSRVLDAEAEKIAYERFPKGCKVRLVQNRCCNATQNPRNLEVEWTVVRWTDYGDYAIERRDVENTIVDREYAVITCPWVAEDGLHKSPLHVPEGAYTPDQTQPDEDPGYGEYTCNACGESIDFV